ncbi:hypothetical protein Ahy_A05g024682 [Arachis hypogaea]|uniref:Reverse transcriptase zinc-binding domain-containing protein n=1 Tax=Arachis hypogaea TaxID=3818 RepID=A0A445D6L6_ARAHY|nr:hypothetical protein Ahy_A05g024682 [Arachis hypogaea]
MWGLTSHGDFSISSAYKSIYQVRGVQDEIWELLWRWKGSQRVKMFYWLALHKKLLTSERRARLFGVSPYCHRCNGCPEILEHVLRDCLGASKLPSMSGLPEILLNKLEITTKKIGLQFFLSLPGCSGIGGTMKSLLHLLKDRKMLDQ